MSFKLLQAIISHLKKKSRCPNCTGGRFTDDSIYILATTPPAPKGNGHGLFFLICPKCHGQAFVLVETGVPLERIKQEIIRIHTKQLTGKVEMNDVLDMRNFLRSYQGDVQELFKEI